MRKLTGIILGVLISQNGIAAEAAVSAPIQPQPRTGTEFEYPELLVAPSASERLSQEAKREAKQDWTSHWAIQTSAAMTLFAGVLSSSDPGKKDLADGETSMTKTASMGAFAVGGGWLAITAALSATYRPYRSGMQSLSGLGRGNKREQLAYERSAEEALYTPARVATVMKWASMASNLAVSGLVIGSAKNDLTKVVGGLSAITSFLPLMFEHHWAQTYDFQNDYKKKIYGPIAFNELTIIQHGNSLAPALTTGIQF